MFTKRFSLGLPTRNILPPKAWLALLKSYSMLPRPSPCPTSPPAPLLLSPPCALPSAPRASLAALPSSWLLFGDRTARTAGAARTTGRGTAGPLPPPNVQFSGAAVRFSIRPLRAAGTAYRGRTSPPSHSGDPTATGALLPRTPFSSAPATTGPTPLPQVEVSVTVLAGVVLGLLVAAVLVRLAIVTILGTTAGLLAPPLFVSNLGVSSHLTLTPSSFFPSPAPRGQLFCARTATTPSCALLPPASGLGWRSCPSKASLR